MQELKSRIIYGVGRMSVRDANYKGRNATEANAGDKLKEYL